MGRISKTDLEAFKITGFNPIALNEGNVQRLFEKCIATDDTKETAYATLFPTALGYASGSEKMIEFDKETLLKNKKTIEYLFGQLHRVHFPTGNYNMSVDDFNTTYQNTYWTKDKVALLKLLYLGVSSSTNFIASFRAATGMSAIAPSIKPTLSPKDPNFSRWWEENKAQWK